MIQANSFERVFQSQQNMRSTRNLSIVLVSLILPLLTQSLSHGGSEMRAPSRRRMLFAASASIGLFVSGTSYAACLPGDLSKECIGVYKVPLDDEILPFVGSEENLKKYAPDLNYVPPVSTPTSYRQAIDSLETQRLASDDIRGVIASGRLEEAGIKVLNLLPKVTTAGTFLLNSVTPPTDDVGRLQLAKQQALFQELQALWGGIDVMIGQGIRGDLGVSAVAQIQILKEIDEAICIYDDFVATVKR